MRVSIVCSSHEHPVYTRLNEWVEARRGQHEIDLVTNCTDLTIEHGDILFLISCYEIVPLEVRQRYKACLVIHASDLPQGRGWSPLVWQILEGRNDITVSLLEADEPVDSGAIWHKIQIHFEGHELCDEIYSVLFEAELKLMDYALDNLESAYPVPQKGEASYYPRRTPEDSCLDVQRSIADQFDLLRVADNKRYPAYFDFRGHRYQVIIRKTDDYAQ